DEELATKDKMIGSLREVLAQGRLEKNGTITFQNRVFRQSDLPKLKEWFEELRTYGAQGSPEGQPLWGLSKQQFDPIYAALSDPIRADPEGVELLKALPLFKLPEAYPLRITRSAEAQLRQEPAPPVIHKSLVGMTQGTALSVALGESGLGFRPRRTPE